MTKFKFEPIFHLAKRTDINWKRAWLIRIGAFILSIVACAVVSTLLTEKGMDFFFKNFFDFIRVCNDSKLRLHKMVHNVNRQLFNSDVFVKINVCMCDI